MKIIKPSIEQMSPVIFDELDFLQQIERVGRVCYKSEDKITKQSAYKFVEKLIKNGHDAMLEHAEHISIKFVCDRGVSHEIVCHRLFSYAQESTRYCNYGNAHEITVIQPVWFEHDFTGEYIFNNLVSDFEKRDKTITYNEFEWLEAMVHIEKAYLTMLNNGWASQQARSVLPNSLKTEIVVTGNLREWRHFFKLRTAGNAHPQMQEVANLALDLLRSQIPTVLKDI